MADEKDKPAATAPAETPPAKQITAPAEAETDRLNRLFEKGGRVLSDDPEVASKADQADIDQLARKAIEWKKSRGVYPWEEPETAKDKQIATQQSEWLRRAGIDPEKSQGDFLHKVQAAVQRLEAKVHGR